VFGFGPAGVAEVNARSARADDGTATFYNPAGLAKGSGYRAEITAVGGISALSAQGKTLPFESPFGFELALDATIPLAEPVGDRIRFGLGGYFLPSSALRLIARPTDAPLFPYYDNRTQRLVLLPALAVRVTRALSVGAAVNVLGGVIGMADVRPGASGAAEPRIQVEASTRAALNTGIRFDPAPGVRLGLTYRPRFSVPARVATTASIGGIPLDVDIEVREALFDPATVVLGSSFDFGRATFEIDAAYCGWSSYAGPFVIVKAELPGVRVGSDPVPELFRDTVSVRGAATYRIDLGERVELTARAGLGFEPSMMTNAQQGRTNLVDGSKTMVGLGASIEVREILPKTMRVGIGANGQFVAGFEQEKRPCTGQPCPINSVAGPDAADPGAGISNPGYPTLRAGGSLWSVALGVGVDL
jgi:long-subunit fatty acid transport protein